jgi:hypothetical protein
MNFVYEDGHTGSHMQQFSTDGMIGIQVQPSDDMRSVLQYLLPVHTYKLWEAGAFSLCIVGPGHAGAPRFLSAEQTVSEVYELVKDTGTVILNPTWN